MNVLASSPELKEAFSQPGAIEIVVLIDNLISERNRFKEAYKDLVQELTTVKELNELKD